MTDKQCSFDTQVASVSKFILYHTHENHVDVWISRSLHSDVFGQWERTGARPCRHSGGEDANTQKGSGWFLPGNRTLCYFLTWEEPPRDDFSKTASEAHLPLTC